MSKENIYKIYGSKERRERFLEKLLGLSFLATPDSTKSLEDLLFVEVESSEYALSKDEAKEEVRFVLNLRDAALTLLKLKVDEEAN